MSGITRSNDQMLAIGLGTQIEQENREGRAPRPAKRSIHLSPAARALPMADTMRLSVSSACHSGKAPPGK